MQQNTWLDPQDKYRPVRPESYGPILPKYRVGPTLADAYAYPPTVGGPVYYGGTPRPRPSRRGGRTENWRRLQRAMPRPCPFFSLGRRCRTISGGLRTMGMCVSRLGTLRSGQAAQLHLQTDLCLAASGKSPAGLRHGRSGTAGRCPKPARPVRWAGARVTAAPVPAESLNVPPPPRPAVPPPGRLDSGPAERPGLDPPKPPPPQLGRSSERLSGELGNEMRGRVAAPRRRDCSPAGSD